MRLCEIGRKAPQTENREMGGNFKALVQASNLLPTFGWRKAQSTGCNRFIKPDFQARASEDLASRD